MADIEFERPVTPNGFCIFCEDVRQEVLGKHSYIGVFIGLELNVLGTLPAAIGKFSIQTTFRQRRDDGLEPVAFEVHMPGDDPDKPSARLEMSMEDAVKTLPPPPADSDDPIISVNAGFEFNPLEIRQEGKIVVSAIKAGKKYRLGTLRVKSRPPEQPKEAAN